MGLDCLIPLAASLIFVASIIAAVVGLEVSHRRQSANLSTQLRADDALIASGRARTSWSAWRQGPGALLIRSGDGPYFLLRTGVPEKTEIRSVVHKAMHSETYGDPRSYACLATDSGLVYFEPLVFPPPKRGKPRKMHRLDMPAHLVRRLKAAGDIQMVYLCWNCLSPLPLDQDHCTHPACAHLEESELDTQTDPMVRGSLMTGGCAGVLGGLLLAWVLGWLSRLFKVPQAFQDHMSGYWWLPAVVLGIVGTLVVYLRLRQGSQESDHQSE